MKTQRRVCSDLHVSLLSRKKGNVRHTDSVRQTRFNCSWASPETSECVNMCSRVCVLQFVHLFEVILTVENTIEVVRLADEYDRLDCFCLSNRLTFNRIL